MSKFKVGDRVEVIKCDCGQPKNIIGTYCTLINVEGALCRSADWSFMEHELELANDRFVIPEPEPFCQQNQDWMLNHLKDIASELENTRDENWLGTSEPFILENRGSCGWGVTKPKVMLENRGDTFPAGSVCPEAKLHVVDNRVEKWNGHEWCDLHGEDYNATVRDLSEMGIVAEEE